MDSEKEARQCWETPQDFFDMMDREFAFDIDVAADEGNTKCYAFIGENSSRERWDVVEPCERGSLALDWFIVSRGTISAWCNPPYKNPIQWIKKAHTETNKNAGTVCVMLLNHDASTKWYSKALQYASEIRILTNKRIQFVAPDGVKASSNAKAQCVIVFRRKLESAPCHVLHWDWQKDLKG